MDQEINERLHQIIHDFNLVADALHHLTSTMSTLTEAVSTLMVSTPPSGADPGDMTPAPGPTLYDPRALPPPPGPHGTGTDAGHPVCGCGKRATVRVVSGVSVHEVCLDCAIERFAVSAPLTKKKGGENGQTVYGTFRA